MMSRLAFAALIAVSAVVATSPEVGRGGRVLAWLFVVALFLAGVWVSWTAPPA